MRIMPFNLVQPVKFNGITKEISSDSYDDNANEVYVTEVRYAYYPFANETKEDIEKVELKLNKTEYDPRPYPSWGTYYDSKVEIKPHLSITQAQYDAIKKQRINDDFIIKTFA